MLVQTPESRDGSDGSTGYLRSSLRGSYNLGDADDDMPKKRITFIVIPANDGQVQEYRFSRWVLWTAAVICFAFVGALGYYAKGYYERVDQQEALARLGAENQDLMSSVELTRRSVVGLEEAMDVLAIDDERLRAYHMMESLSAEERMGGVGGSEELPEDYTALPVNKRTMIEDLNARIHRLQQEAKVQEISFEEIRRKYLETEGTLRHFPTISPVSRERTWISSLFGYRNDPFTGKKAFHSGIDFAGRTSTPIQATADGVVSYAYKDIRLGNVIVIDHDIQEVNEEGEVYTRKGVYRTEYGHMDKFAVKKGQRVQRGQQIGTMGSSGRSTGPHLHYAVRFQDRRRGGYKGYEDPKNFLLDKISRDAQVANWWHGDD